MFKCLTTLSMLAICSVAAARADTITGYLSASGGTDSFTSSSITFEPTAVIGGTVGGTFANYLADGDAITFNSFNTSSGALPYTQGMNTAPGGQIELFQVQNAAKTETFTYYIQSYDATYGSSLVSGCTSGDTCLNVTGNGYFTGTGLTTYTDSPATFQFDTSYVPGQTIGTTVTSFAGQASTTGVTTGVAPEPGTLVLLGTGMLGLAGVARRKLLKV